MFMFVSSGSLAVRGLHFLAMSSPAVREDIIADPLSRIAH
jgi:hypothetical protein